MSYEINEGNELMNWPSRLLSSNSFVSLRRAG